MVRLPIAFLFSASRSKNWSSLALSSVWAWPAVNSASAREIANNVLVLISDWCLRAETTAPRANISRLFFFRENYRPTAAFQDHLVFRGVELENDPPAEELKFILRRRFERGSVFTARLNEERPAVPRDGPFLGGVGAGINADVFVQDFRTYGDRFEGGNLERFTVVDVDRAADNVLDRVNLRVGGVGHH